MKDTPFVSCIMPTYNRREFVPDAIRYFLRQDYESKELIIIDDGIDSIEDLVPENPGIRYLRLDKKHTIGTKRNMACEEASGEIIAHWDDDDWMAPHRLSYQVEALTRGGPELDLCGTNRLLFYDMNAGLAWEYVYPGDQRFWLSGNTLCYKRSFWDRHRFEDIDVGEDGLFVWKGDPGRMLALPDPTFHVGMIHKANASPKQTHGVYWQPYPVAEIQQLLGDDWPCYSPGRSRSTGGSALAPGSAKRTGVNMTAGERDIPMITAAERSDLDFTEYAAFGHGQTLPLMRRWELPFALFQSRLSNGMSVLDCTINPVSFRERLTCLYPHVLYRHWNPIQNGGFVLPLGVPDGTFDRVICINTLEHLLKSQREALMEDMARKLKPGGLLVLTSDYYFDSSWERREFLESGVMRADRREVFNGMNKVTPREWRELCRKNDLHPMSKIIPDPGEDDPVLFRQEAPYSHACIGGVFSKTRTRRLPQPRNILLALLTWNTRDISIDSVRAYVREADMLRRLGHSPFICVCDNGSTDGTADALRSLKKEIHVPHRFIFNRRNRGNSRARNQIIDCMLQGNADYLLFMDGDIEIVPFSSFAMMRYMENNGHRLGCIGADSAGQSNRREAASQYFYNIQRVDTLNLVAWTQYGMFRREVFEDGVRFDENSPFDGVGWGFEDNDLAFQMEMKGYINQRFFGMTYLHRDARSSIRIMRKLGVDAHLLCQQRQEYVINKWESVPVINNGPLRDIRDIRMRF